MKAKKLISMLLAALMVFNLTACGGGGNEDELTLKWPTNIVYGAATVGIPYAIQKFMAEDSAGTKYTPTIEIENNDLGTLTDYDGEADSFTFSAAGSYTIRYKVTFKGAEAKKEYAITVSESLAGNKEAAITAIEQAANAKIGQPTKYSKEKRDALAALVVEYTDLINEASTQSALDTAKSNGLEAIGAIKESGAPIINQRQLESKGTSDEATDTAAYVLTDITDGFNAKVTSARAYSSIRLTVSDYTPHYSKLSMTVKNNGEADVKFTIRVSKSYNSSETLNGQYGHDFTIKVGRTITVQTDVTLTGSDVPQAIFIYPGSHDDPTPAFVDVDITDIEFLKMDGLHVGQLAVTSGSGTYFDVDNARINYNFPLGFGGVQYDEYKSVEWPISNFNLGTYNYAKITIANFGNTDIGIQAKSVDVSGASAQDNYGSGETIYANGGLSYVYASELCKITDGVKKPEQLTKLQLFIRPFSASWAGGEGNALTQAVTGYLTVDIELLENWPARIGKVLGNTTAPVHAPIAIGTEKDLSYSFNQYVWNTDKYEAGTPIAATVAVKNSEGAAVPAAEFANNKFTPTTAGVYTITYTATFVDDNEQNVAISKTSTIEVVADVLQLAKDSAIEELEDYLDELISRNSYSEDAIEELEGILGTAIYEIGGATTAGEIDEIVANAKADMDALTPIPVLTTNGSEFIYGNYINGMDNKITVTGDKNFKSTEPVNQNAGYAKFNLGHPWNDPVLATQVAVVVQNNMDAQRYLRIEMVGAAYERLNGAYGQEFAIGAKEVKIVVASIASGEPAMVHDVNLSFGGTNNGGDTPVDIDFTIHQVCVAQEITTATNGSDVSYDDATGLFNIDFKAVGNYNNYYQGVIYKYEGFEYKNNYNIGAFCLEIDLTDSQEDLSIQFKIDHEVYKQSTNTWAAPSQQYIGFQTFEAGKVYYLDSTIWYGISGFDSNNDNLRNVMVELQIRPANLTDNALATAFDVDFGLNFVVGNPSDINQDYGRVLFNSGEVDAWKSELDAAVSATGTAGTEIVLPSGALTLGGKTATVAVAVKDGADAAVTLADNKFTPSVGTYTVTYTATYHDHTFTWSRTITVA